jgi:hypothetical protein
VEKEFAMNTKNGILAVLVVVLALGGCAATGTKVTSSSDGYRDMAKSQQTWCGTFPDSCACYIDGNRATCSLVYACMNSGNCKAAP